MNIVVFLFFLFLILSPGLAKAVMPPDFVFNLTGQIIQAFSAIVLILSAATAGIYQFSKTWFSAHRFGKWLWVLIAGIILIIALGLAFYYGNFKQKQALQNWLKKAQQQIFPTSNNTTPDNLDQLKIGQAPNQNSVSDTRRFISYIPANVNDVNTQFIIKYYQNIGEGKLDEAYAMSKKAVSLDVFRDWYKNTTKLTLDKLVQIDDERSSLELTLYEGSTYTNYGVLMTLALSSGLPQSVEKSEVRILSQGDTSLLGSMPTVNTQDNSFFDQNQDKSTVITNQEFSQETSGNNNNYLVLDARENLEYENGHFPTGVHIRFADLKAGRWIELPKDKFIYVLCWSGIRGKEVTDFLRGKKIVASYLENGANGWVAFGGKWIGSIKFADKYSTEAFTKVFTTDETKQKLAEGVFLVDSREPDRFKAKNIPGSVSIPIMYTPTISMETTFAQVPAGVKVITVCDGYVNCFDAKITGAELEKRGHEFVGRYATPWEW